MSENAQKPNSASKIIKTFPRLLSNADDGNVNIDAIQQLINHTKTSKNNKFVNYILI